MPELPEVRVISEELDRALRGKHLIGISFDSSSRHSRLGMPNKTDLDSLLPLRILNVKQRGKKIIFELEREIYLISFLGLEGHWNWVREKHSNLSLEIGKQEGFMFILDPILYFTDTRHFGFLNIALNRAALDNDLKTTGPDFFSSELTLEYWRGIWLQAIQKIHSGKLKDKQLCEFLMDQKKFSGIGNYIKAEVLYRVRLRPDRSITSISQDQIDAIYSTAKDVIESSYASQGLTIKTYWSPTGGKGIFQVAVYGKTTDPYGNQVITGEYADKRTTHWVPALQQ